MASDIYDNDILDQKEVVIAQVLWQVCSGVKFFVFNPSDFLNDPGIIHTDGNRETPVQNGLHHQHRHALLGISSSNYQSEHQLESKRSIECHSWDYQCHSFQKIWLFLFLEEPCVQNAGLGVDG